jgi:hypothetical protein
MDSPLAIAAIFYVFLFLVATFLFRSRLLRVLLAGFVMTLLCLQLAGLLFAAGWNRAWGGGSDDGTGFAVTVIEFLLFGLWSLTLLPKSEIKESFHAIKETESSTAETAPPTWDDSPGPDPDADLKRKANEGRL